MSAEQPTFHLGLTMAGAVSAGAYTAGVIDYLLEALDTWEKYKKTGLGTLPVPQHQVKIEVVGGASAGGVTAALMALAAKVGIEPVREEDYEAACKPDFKPNNLLFEAWVNMVDEPKGKDTFQQMLGTEDIVEDQVPSLLNSKVIDTIAEQALNGVEAQWDNGKSLPPYIAEDLDVLLTLCSLKGVPMGIEFDSGNEQEQKINPSYQMQTHKLLARFNFPNQNENGATIGLTAVEGRKRLIECAKSTAAFPIGLAARPIKGLSKDYLKLQFATFSKLKPKALERIFKDLKDPFDFVSIDGGTLNNEPFGEIETLLKQKNIDTKQERAIIMVDPFPNFTNPSDQKGTQAEDEPSTALNQILGPIFSTLLDQGRFKEQDLAATIDTKEGACRKNMIFPSRRTNQFKKVDVNHLACGALGGFSGFIDRQFRVHDFFLGRKNCRNFLRFYFGYDCNPDKPETLPDFYKGWKAADILKIGVPTPGSKTQYRLPIVPCFDFIEAFNVEKEKHKDQSVKDINGKIGYLHPFPFPQLTAEMLVDRYEQPLLQRAQKIVDALGQTLQKPKTKVGTTDGSAEQKLEQFLAQKYATGWWGKIKQWITKGIAKRVVPGVVANGVKNAVLKGLLKDLNGSGLLRW